MWVKNKGGLSETLGWFQMGPFQFELRHTDGHTHTTRTADHISVPSEQPVRAIWRDTARLSALQLLVYFLKLIKEPIFANLKPLSSLDRTFPVSYRTQVISFVIKNRSNTARHKKIQRETCQKHRGPPHPVPNTLTLLGPARWSLKCCHDGSAPICPAQIHRCPPEGTG